MKNNIGRGIFIACLGSLAIACHDTPEGKVSTPADKERIKREIQDKENEFAATYNAGELKNIGYYADDAISYSNRPPLVGKEEIVNALKTDLISNTNKISFQTKEVFVSSDENQVVEIGHFDVVDSTNTNINSGNYMSIFEKRNGKYVCVRDMSTSQILSK